MKNYYYSYNIQLYLDSSEYYVVVVVVVVLDRFEFLFNFRWLDS